MEATKRTESLSWHDTNETKAELEAVKRLAAELRTDYPTNTADEPTNWRNEAINRRNGLIRAQFIEDGAWVHMNGERWIEMFDLVGFCIDKETRKRFIAYLKRYTFWYGDFNKRISHKYAQRIHWYIENFLLCLHNHLQTEKDYREGKYGEAAQAYYLTT